MKPVAKVRLSARPYESFLLDAIFLPPCNVKDGDLLYTADQLREAQVKALLDAAALVGVGRAYEADANFIALANPATILELCALLEKAEGALETLTKEVLIRNDCRPFPKHVLPAQEALAAIKQWKEQT